MQHYYKIIFNQSIITFRFVGGCWTKNIHKLYWSIDNILIALGHHQRLYVFNCNQISRLYLKSCTKFKKYPKDELFKLDTPNKNHKKTKSKKLLTIANRGMNDQKDILKDEKLKEHQKHVLDKNKLHQQISKKLIEIGDASNAGKDNEMNEKNEGKQDEKERHVY